MRSGSCRSFCCCRKRKRDGLALLPTIGEQKDIRYHAARARGLLNGPESTGMDYWSINPYVGCAFGCTYCYARYAHRYAVDRALSASASSHDLRAEIDGMPPWLAFERHVLVKSDAAAILGHELAARQSASRGVNERRSRRDRNGNRSVSAGGASVPCHAGRARDTRVSRGALDCDHHEESAHYAGRRCPAANHGAVVPHGSSVAHHHASRARATHRAASADAGRADSRGRSAQRGGRLMLGST